MNNRRVKLIISMFPSGNRNLANKYTFDGEPTWIRVLVPELPLLRKITRDNSQNLPGLIFLPPIDQELKRKGRIAPPPVLFLFVRSKCLIFPPFRIHVTIGGECIRTFEYMMTIAGAGKNKQSNEDNSDPSYVAYPTRDPCTFDGKYSKLTIKHKATRNTDPSWNNDLSRKEKKIHHIVIRVPDEIKRYSPTIR